MSLADIKLGKHVEAIFFAPGSKRNLNFIALIFNFFIINFFSLVVLYIFHLHSEEKQQSSLVVSFILCKLPLW